MAVFTGQRYDCAAAARLLLHHLDRQYDTLCTGDLATLESNWGRRLGLLGQQVVAECPDGLHVGWLRTLTWERVELLRPDGIAEQLRPEMVTHLMKHE